MRSLLVSLLFFAMLVSPQARAEDNRASARALGEAGLALYEQQKFAEALKRFEMAEALLHAPTLVLFMARCKRGLGEFLAARALYERVINDDLGTNADATFVKAQNEAKSELGELDQTIPSVRIVVTGVAEASVTVDGREVSNIDTPMRLDPGRHEIVATAPGVQPVRKRVELDSDGSVQEVTLAFHPKDAQHETAPPAEEGSLVPAAVCFSIGGAALIAGIATGIVAIQKFDELKARCPDDHCAPEDEPLKEEVDMYGVVSTVGIAVGAAGIVAGIVLAIVRPGGGTAAAGRLRIGPRSVSLRF
ncbi:MAG TPA: PEGA domain-containing protein [Polyangiaceae bacterium]|nr:PEGA domain-containing protein [Polyangiaceae bacterium]